jgi:hypothetical protein
MLRARRSIRVTISTSPFRRKSCAVRISSPHRTKRHSGASMKQSLDTRGLPTPARQARAGDWRGSQVRRHWTGFYQADTSMNYHVSHAAIVRAASATSASVSASSVGDLPR